MTARPNRAPRVALAAALALAGSSCGGDTSTPSSPSGSASTGITDDTALFRLFTATDPVSGYTVFPNADEYDTGRLNGSEAHRPVIRVRLNAIASAVLVNGRLPANTAFADGSIIVKEIRQAATTPLSLYAVMVKDRGNALAGNGWLWAEHGPSGFGDLLRQQSWRRLHELPPARARSRERPRAHVRAPAVSIALAVEYRAAPR